MTLENLNGLHYTADETNKQTNKQTVWFSIIVVIK
jgi:hypothetical protein